MKEELKLTLRSMFAYPHYLVVTLALYAIVFIILFWKDNGFAFSLIYDNFC